MEDYRTAEEKAAEYNLTSRSVQQMCKAGKIDGAKKMSGIWFIPADSLLPVKNTKSDFKSFEFVGTKKDIFESAIELFMQKGFENVRMKELAELVGISQGAIYNHFKSKQEILDTIYDFYSYHYIADRPDPASIEPVLKDGSLEDIIANLRYEFKYLKEMTSIIKIIFQRMIIDERAKEIAKFTLLDDGLDFSEAVFNKAVDSGRISPVDTHATALFIHSIRLYTLYAWLIDPSPERMARVLDEERNQFKLVAAMLTDLKTNDIHE